MSHPPTVERYLPTLLLDPCDGYPPADPDDFLRGAHLVWNGGGFREVADPAALLAAEFSGYRGSDCTRPYEVPALRPPRLFASPEAGFCLARDEDAGHLDIPRGAVEPDFPVLYEHVPGHFVTYWLFYAWSTLPSRLHPRYALDASEKEYLGAREIDAENFVPTEFRIAYPGLTRDFAPVLAEALAPTADVDLGDGTVVAQRVRFSLLDVIERLRTVFRLIRRRAVHEGDWERISVRLDPEDRITQIAYYQHSGPPEIVPAAAVSERPVVRVARGSHASYPPEDDLRGPGLVEQMELFGDFRLDLRPQQLRDVRAQPWYGFGGAWGRVLGTNSNEVGPLGPSPYKPPTPFVKRP